MSRIDIAELNDFLHGLRSSNAEAKTMIKQIKEAAIHYTQDNSLKGAAVTTSKQYFSSTYTSIAQSILEALDESEERLAQYIREFGSQVDSSPSSRIDAEVLQEAMAKVSQLRRKEDNLHQQLTAPNTRPDMQQVYTVQSRSVHTQLLEAIEKEQILEKYLAFEQSHGQFFSALDELIRATGRAVQALLQQVTFNEKTGAYSVPTIATNSLLLMNKALQAARKENDKDPFPKAFEDYTLFAYTYVNDQGETVTMWLLERDGKRATNQELQDFLEEHDQELNPLLYTNLSGGVLKSSAYVASVKDAMDDAGLTEMTLSLGFGIAAARNKTIMAKKVKEPEVGKISERIKNDSKTVQKNIELSKKAREASKMKEYLKREKAALEKIKKASGAGIVQSRINLAEGPTRFSPSKNAGMKHVRDRHFNPSKNSGQFTISESELKNILQSESVIKTTVKELKSGGFERVVDTGKVVGTVKPSLGGQPTTWIKVITDKAGNIITTYPIPKP
ncbi:T7SS effector LXG polymorphic toxin [Listeria welshimeri]